MRFMTIIALGILVMTEQREVRQVMVKENFVIPCVFIVAILATNALSAFMRIVLRMTIVAFAEWRHFEYRLNMALGAFDRCVHTV